MQSQWAVVSGGFKKTEELHNERPVYFNEGDKTWMFHSEKRKQWKAGGDPFFFCDMYDYHKGGGIYGWGL